MSDSYQAVYDAVRSRIGSCNIQSVIENVAYSAFDFGHARALLQEQIAMVGNEMVRPSVIWRPRVFPDGSQWCALYGDNLQEGVAAFGDTPELACAAFDKAWHERIAP